MLRMIASLGTPRARLVAALLLLSGCSRGAPPADTAAVPDASAPPASAPATPATPATPAAPAPVDTSVTPPAAAPSARDTTPSRPRLVPRPPRPVPLPMPGRETAPSIQPSGGDEASDQAILDRLRRDARALARAEGCTAVDQCTVLPVGVRACGGPSEYLVYCPRSTDVAALRRKVAEIDRADRAFNTKYEVMSTCELRTPPTAELAGGACRAAASSSPR